jgi:hypothetical protein
MYRSFKKNIMTNKNKKNKSREEDVRSSSGAQTTTPVNLRSGDKLRENPSNDEETIAQNPRQTDRQSAEQSQLSRDHVNDMTEVTNEEEQQKVVNPSGGDWDEPEEDPTPKIAPYEGVNDDPDGTRRKIPKM